MTLYECAPDPAVRAAEMDLAGRRVAARAIPFVTEAGPVPWRFDPIERRFLARSATGPVSVGPFDEESWRAAFARVAPGAVLVGPCDAAEQIRGAYAGAAQGARLAGRGAYLLDPMEAGLPEEGVEGYVAVFVCLSASAVAGTLVEAVRRDLASGVLLPLIPGWTCETEVVEAMVAQAAARGSRFVSGIVPAEDGAARRSIVEARAQLDPEAPEDFFEHIHHGDWSGEIERARLCLKEACARSGLASLPQRPLGRGEPAPNAAAAGCLEEKADAVAGSNEHLASLLHAAARWIDESGHDLALIVREGNFRKIFPFGEELARHAEDALRSGS